MTHNIHTFFSENLTCNKPLDLVIALDSSESIREANWTKLIGFTKAVVKTLDPALTRVSVIRYNTNAEVPIPLGKHQSFDDKLLVVFHTAMRTC